MANHPDFDGTCTLPDRGVIRARGADAETFLQGQLTNDVASMTAETARLAGFCSAKGRLQASFIVLRPAADEFLLVCAADVLAPTLKRLSMFVLRAKCVLGDASGELSLSGCVGRQAHDLGGSDTPWRVQPHGGGYAVSLPAVHDVERSLLVLPVASDIDASPSLPLDRWNWLDVQSGVVTIEAASVDRFVPQMVNHELIGAVDFKKGCYPGQEVVARSQYRGTTKRRTFLFDVDAAARAGDDVYGEEAGGEAVGTVANAAPRPDGGGSSALVEVRLATLGSSLHLRSADGPVLHRSALPYAVPLESEAVS